MCSHLGTFLALNVLILRKTMDYKWVKLSKSGCFKSFELNTSSYRVFYGLSENRKMIVIKQIKLQVIAILKG